ERECTDRQLGLAVSRCIAHLSGDKPKVLATSAGFEREPLTRQVHNLLRYHEVRVWLVAWYIAGQLEHQRSEDELHWRWPLELLDEVARRTHGKAGVVHYLDRLLTARRRGGKGAMAASLILRIDPTWRPLTQPGVVWQLEHAHLAGAHWPLVNLSKAHLRRCDLSGANLQEAILGRAVADAATFDGAHLLSLHAPGLSASDAKIGRSSCSEHV